MPAAEKPAPLLAIVGQPNVGKSSLFNRLIHRHQSLVDSMPGLTRDRLYGQIRWEGVFFRVVDTGGLQFLKDDTLQQSIAKQVQHAMEEADLVLFVCDGRQGVTPLDRQVAGWLRRGKKPVFLIINKMDENRDLADINEFSELGWGTPWPISAQHGLGIGDLLAEILAYFKKAGISMPKDPMTGKMKAVPGVPDPLRLAFIGRPNVGKSSLMNQILDEERVLVDDQPGTTRDPVEVMFRFRQKSYCLIDTAGIRSQKTLKSKVDAVSRIKALQTVERAHICVGVVDASAGLIADDLKLFDFVATAGRPLCLVVNKWDLLPRTALINAVSKKIVERAPFLRYAAVVATSALTGFRVSKVLDEVQTVAESAWRTLTVSECARILEHIVGDSHAPAGVRHAHWIRLYQVAVGPPTFHVLVRVKHALRPAETTYFESVLTREAGFYGTPVRVRYLVKK